MGFCVVENSYYTISTYLQTIFLQCYVLKLGAATSRQVYRGLAELMRSFQRRSRTNKILRKGKKMFNGQNQD